MTTSSSADTTPDERDGQHRRRQHPDDAVADHDAVALGRRRRSCGAPSSSGVAVAGSSRATDATAVDDEERVGQADQLLEIGRDEDRGQAGGARRAQLVPDRRLGADVDPRVGWAATSAVGAAISSRPMISFCWLPPDSASRGHVDARRAHVELGRRSRSVRRPGPGAVDPRPPGVRRLGLVAEHLVLPQRCVEQQAVALAVLGHVAEPRLAPAPGRPRGDVLVAEADATGVDARGGP